MMLREFPIATQGRITLTKKHLTDPTIAELLNLLVEISIDGVLEYEELERLTIWLNAHSKSEVPAIRFLFDLMLHICADGRVSSEDLFDLQLGIERVVPKQFRESISRSRKTRFYAEPATDRQMEILGWYLKPIPSGLTRGRASELITEFMENPPATNRQIMFLRFWDRTDLIGMNRNQISEWMSEFVDSDSRRMAAWSLFKEEYGDDGSQRDPSWVPIGVAPDYYSRVQII